MSATNETLRISSPLMPVPPAAGMGACHCLEERIEARRRQLRAPRVEVAIQVKDRDLEDTVKECVTV